MLFYDYLEGDYSNIIKTLRLDLVRVMYFMRYVTNK